MKIEDQTQCQKNELICALLLTLTGQKLDAIKAKLEFQKNWGINEDWHEYSYAFDHLHRMGKVKLRGHNRDGMGIYEVSGKGVE